MHLKSNSLLSTRINEEIHLHPKKTLPLDQVNEILNDLEIAIPNLNPLLHFPLPPWQNLQLSIDLQLVQYSKESTSLSTFLEKF